MVSNNRLQVGKAMLRKYASVFKRIEQQYGVPGPVLVAYWGLETDFGKVMGNLPSIQSLATLSYDCRRPDEFREQLMYALKVIDRGDTSATFQFWSGLDRTRIRLTIEEIELFATGLYDWELHFHPRYMAQGMRSDDG